MGVYNSISHIQRIAFIDGLTDARAEELSNNYPFAICYADDGNGMQNYIPGFWKQGKRYGIKAVDTTPIIINGIEFALQLENNVLKLYSGSIIKHISLVGDPDTVFEIYNVHNTLPLTFRFYKDNNEEDEVYNNFPILIISDEDGDIDNPTSNYSSIFNIERSESGNTYNLMVKNNYEGIYPLKFMYNQYTNEIRVQIKPFKFPQNINWENNSITIDNSINNTQLINFTIDTTKYHIDASHFTLNNINFIVTQAGSSIPVSNFITSNILFNSETGEGTITINCEGREGAYIITTKFIDSNGESITCSNKLNITFEAKLAAGDLYYIGKYESISSQISNDEILVQTVQVNPNIYERGWHNVNDQMNIENNYYDYERSPFAKQYDCVIIPEEYSLYLPLFKDEALQTRRVDEWWDNYISNHTIVVNSRSYKMYTNFESSVFVNSILILQS